MYHSQFHTTTIAARRMMLTGVLLLLSNMPLFSQQSIRIDSLNRVLKAARGDQEKVDIQIGIATAYTNLNVDSSVNIGQRAFALAKRIQYNSGLATAYGIYGRCLINAARYDEAILLCKEGLTFLDKLLTPSKAGSEQVKWKKSKATILKNLGIAHDFTSNYPEALRYYMQSLKLEEALGDKRSSAGSYHNIGGIYLEYKKYDEALSYFLKAYQINKEFNNQKWLTNNLTNIALVYSYKGDYASAMKRYNEVLRLYECIDDQYGRLTTISNIANLHKDMGNQDSCILYLKQVIQLNQEIGDPRMEETAYALLGLLYVEQGQLAKARVMLDKADALVHELGDYSKLEEYYYARFLLDSSLGNLTNAIRYIRLSEKYGDSVFNEDNVRRLTQIQMNYDFEKRESAAQAAQEKKDALAAKELQRQKLIRNGILAGFVVVLVFSMVFLRQRNRISKEKKRSEELLLNILPEEVAQELKDKGEAEARLIDEVTVLFTDFKGFTALSEKLTPKELVQDLHECFTAFDNIMQRHGLEKIKTIGDAYMAAGGLPTPNSTHATDVVRAALEIRQFMEHGKLKKMASKQPYFEIRIGVHTGPVVAGIVGVKKFSYDIWGDTVNTASRMESSGEVGKVNISESTYALVHTAFHCIHRGKIQAKGKGEIDMYFVEESNPEVTESNLQRA